MEFLYLYEYVRHADDDHFQAGTNKKETAAAPAAAMNPHTSIILAWTQNSFTNRKSFILHTRQIFPTGTNHIEMLPYAYEV